MQNDSSSISPERRAAKNEAKRRHYARHRERLAEVAKVYRQENKAEISKRRRKRYASNRASFIEKSRQFAKENPEKNREYKRKRRLKDPQKCYDSWYASNLKYRYGISIDEYNAMFAAQGGCCAICLEPRVNSKGKLHVDHCHETGKVRGLLCHHCNSVLGHARDNTAVLERAISYLKENG